MSADLIHRKRVLNNQDYILSMRAVFNVRALYSDTTSNYLGCSSACQWRQKARHDQNRD